MNKINKALFLILAILLLISIFRFSEDTEDFSTYNNDWNGGMQVRVLLSENHKVVALPARQYITSFDPARSALVVLGPGENFSEKDVETIREFVHDGGLLILADDFGRGNQLLNIFTPSVTFSNRLLQDDMSFWKNSTFPVVSTNIGNVSNITLNYPTSLTITDRSAIVLANTSRFAWILKDLKREQMGSFPVMAEIPSGKGRIVAISDPSIFINSMLPFTDNKLLLDKLVENRTYVNFDETGRTPPVMGIYYHIRTNSYLQYLLAFIILSMAYIYMKRDQLSVFRRKKINGGFEQDEEAIISDILKKNNWDERKFELFRNKRKVRK